MTEHITTRAQMDQLEAHCYELAIHHARQHRGIIAHLADGVWKWANRSSIYTRGRGVWFEVGEQRYFLGYDYFTKEITFRDRSTRGPALYVLTGKETRKAIRGIFSELVERATVLV